MTHKTMSEKEARAAQFAPFSPLKGYYDLILKKKHENDEKNELPYYEKTNWEAPSLE